MPENTTSPYPAWDQQLDANRDHLEREIEDWYKRNADRASHAAAAADGAAAERSWFDRAGEEVAVLYSDVKARLQQVFGVEADELTQQEYDRAWQDEAHWQARIRSTAEKLEQDGRFGK